MDRGSAIHKQGEDYINGSLKTVPKELKTFGAEFRMLRELKASAEALWAFNSKWSPVEWYAPSAWCRVKTDIFTHKKDPKEALIADIKTGKQYDEHEDQLSLYAVGGFIMSPEVETIETALWYVDIGEETKKTFQRDELLSLRKDWERKVAPMLNDKQFAPSPSRDCSWCPHSKSKGGLCQY